MDSPPTLLRLCEQLSLNCVSLIPSNYYRVIESPAVRCSFALGTLLTCYCNRYGDSDATKGCAEMSNFVLPEEIVIHENSLSSHVSDLLRYCETPDLFYTSGMVCFAIDSAIKNMHAKTKEHVVLLAPNTAHRILCAAFIVTHKMQTDIRHSMSEYALATRITNTTCDVAGTMDAIDLECSFLHACDFGITLSENLVTPYSKALRGISTQMHP